MQTTDNIKKDLELEDILAIIGVLVIAAIFIWYQTGFGNNEKASELKAATAATPPTIAAVGTPAVASSTTAASHYTLESRQAEATLNSTGNRAEAETVTFVAAQPAAHVTPGPIEPTVVATPTSTEKTQPAPAAVAAAVTEPVLDPPSLESDQLASVAVAEPNPTEADTDKATLPLPEKPTASAAAADTVAAAPAGIPFRIERNLQTNHIDFRGQAGAADQLRLNINGVIGEAIIADATGYWSLSTQLEAGIHTLQLLTLNADGSVARTTESFSYEILPVNESSAGQSR